MFSGWSSLFLSSQTHEQSNELAHLRAYFLCRQFSKRSATGSTWKTTEVGVEGEVRTFAGLVLTRLWGEAVRDREAVQCNGDNLSPPPSQNDRIWSVYAEECASRGHRGGRRWCSGLRQRRSSRRCSDSRMRSAAVSRSVNCGRFADKRNHIFGNSGMRVKNRSRKEASPIRIWRSPQN